jgi:F-type H+-transporting ATPase subunit b
MKRVNKIVWVCCFIVAGAVGLHLLAPEALAAESSGSWRFIYDEVLLWINFLIIVFVFIKYGKTPLMNFLRGQKDKIARELEKIEHKKKEAIDKIDEARITLEESQERFAVLKERIVNQGEKKKQEIIKEAHHLSEVMIEDAKRKIEYQILQARNTIRAQMLNAAIDLAMGRLPREITDEDNEKFIDQYIASAMAE